jgi:EmrB/QacA subfamily drug resistance transporter
MSHDYPVLAEPERRRIVIGALIAMFVSALDQTIVAPTLPTLAVALGDPEWLSWVITSYLLTSTAVTPLYGKIADIRGRRPTLIVAMVLFLVGSALCGLAGSMPALVAARVVQGLGGGGLVAVSQTIIGDVVPPKERGLYSAYISGLWATASLAGPVLGGILTQHVHWSAIFWINLPIGFIGIVVALRALALLPDVRRPHRLDVVGSALVASGTVALLLGLTFGARDGRWTAPMTVGLLVGGVVGLTLFIAHLYRTPEPLVPPRVLTNPVIRAALGGLVFITGVNIGLTIYTPAYFELLHGLTPAQSGLAMLPLMGGSVVGAAFTGRRMRRDPHYRRYAIGGSLLAGTGLAILAIFAPVLPFWSVETVFFVVGTGFSMNFPVVTVSVQNAAQRGDLGVATAGLAFVRSMGGMAGVAAFGTVLLAVGAIGPATGEGAAGHDAAAMLSGYRVVLACAVVAVAASILSMLAMAELPLRGASDVPDPAKTPIPSPPPPGGAAGA